MVLLLALLAALPVLHAQSGDRVLLVVNRGDPVSRQIAEYYRPRRSIPTKNVCYLDTKAEEEITWETYATQVERPIAACLEKNNLQEKVLYIVTTLGTPLKVEGGGSGLLVALLGVDGLRAILPANVPRAAALSLDLPVLAVAFALTLATGLLFGLAPAWAATRTDVNSSIRQGRRTTPGAGGFRLRQGLVAGEFALATMLIVGAGLLLASFLRLQAVSFGFEPQNVLTARISLPKARYSRDRAYAFYRDLELELGTVPGMQAAGVASNVPFDGGNPSMTIIPLDEAQAAPDRLVQASWRTVTSGYFQAL
ncbi:MAG: TIGR03790 family protein, partial [Acidobacteriia bacterium]|nr:TIGR03790 family protein [Terriglobia bacterium]